MTNVFVYGSLMFKSVWQYVVRGAYQSTAASVYGFTRYAVKDEAFPAVLKTQPNDQLNGLLYFDVSASDLKKLDDYEGELYLRQTIKAFYAQPDTPSNNKRKSHTDELLKTSIDAAIYVIHPSQLAILSDQLWDVDAFARQIDSYQP